MPQPRCSFLASLLIIVEWQRLSTLGVWRATHWGGWERSGRRGSDRQGPKQVSGEGGHHRGWIPTDYTTGFERMDWGRAMRWLRRLPGSGNAIRGLMRGWNRVLPRIVWHEEMVQEHVPGAGRMTSLVRSAMLIHRAKKYCRGGGVIGDQISAELAACAVVRHGLPL